MLDVHSIDAAKMLAELRDRGWSVLDDVLPAATVAGLNANIQAKFHAGTLIRAGIGQGTDRHVSDAIRGDYIDWLDAESRDICERDCLASLNELGRVLSRGMMMSYAEFECHYACYPPDRGYAKHVDVFRANDQRFLSAVLYLNESWQPEDGGQLRIFSEADSNQVAADIDPKGGRLVVFLSRQIHHQVLPTRKERRSVTGWFKQRAEQPLAAR